MPINAPCLSPHLHEQEIAAACVAHAALRLPHKPRPPPAAFLQHPLAGQPAGNGYTAVQWLAVWRSPYRCTRQIPTALQEGKHWQAAANSSPAHQPTQHTAAARTQQLGNTAALCSITPSPHHTTPPHPPACARPCLPLLHLSHCPVARALELWCISCLIRARVGAESQREACHQVLGCRLVRAAGPDHKLLRGGHAHTADGACGGGGGRDERVSGRRYGWMHRLVVSVKCTRSAAQALLGLARRLRCWAARGPACRRLTRLIVDLRKCAATRSRPAGVERRARAVQTSSCRWC